MSAFEDDEVTSPIELPAIDRTAVTLGETAVEGTPKDLADVAMLDPRQSER